MTARVVEFEACFNFRDLGGYETADGRRTRWGRLYRSDTLHRLTAGDVDVFRSLGLRTVIDLRAITELDDHGSLRDDAREELVWHHLPMVDRMMLRPRSGTEVAEVAEVALVPTGDRVPEADGYLRMLGDGSAVARIVELVTEPEGMPAVFHCTSGKDRTGIVAALVLDVLGVPDAVIGTDYELTKESRARSAPWIKANEPTFHAFLAQVPASARSSEPERIIGFLERVRAAHGSVEAFLLGAGVTEAQLARLRDDLLE
jgi:protein-tyrosine phosphatase